MLSFKIWMKLIHNNLETEAQKSFANRCRTGALSLSCNSTPTARNFSAGFCLRVIVNEFHPNLVKMTSSDLSSILINLCIDLLWCGNRPGHEKRSYKYYDIANYRYINFYIWKFLNSLRGRQHSNRNIAFLQFF